jgi:hypothetical protein
MFDSTIKRVFMHKELVIAASVVTILVWSLSSAIPNAAAQISIGLDDLVNIDINDYLIVDVNGVHIRIPTGGADLGDLPGGFLP